MALREYLYLDKGRISRYFGQISSPEKIENTNNSKFSVGLTKLALEVSNGEHRRQYTLMEQTEIVEKYIKNSNQFFSTKQWTSESESIFCEETTNARRIRIRDELNLWVAENNSSENEKGYGHLFLIEDFGRPDMDAQFVTSYSSLRMLLSNELFNLYLEDGNPINRLFKNPLEERNFNLNPIKSLAKIGITASDERKITSLYRIRSVCFDWDNDHLMSVFAYPILIYQ